VNVGLLGIKSEKHDEGTKNFGINLADALQTSVDEVLYINIQAGIGLTELKQLRNHDLDLVHLIPGPTFKGLFLLEMVGRYTGARTVATALQPVSAVCRSRLRDCFLQTFSLSIPLANSIRW